MQADLVFCLAFNMNIMFLQTYIYNPSAETSKYPGNNSRSQHTNYNASFFVEEVRKKLEKCQNRVVGFFNFIQFMNFD